MGQEERRDRWMKESLKAVVGDICRTTAKRPFELIQVSETVS